MLPTGSTSTVRLWQGDERDLATLDYAASPVGRPALAPLVGSERAPYHEVVVAPTTSGFDFYPVCGRGVDVWPDGVDASAVFAASIEGVSADPSAAAFAFSGARLGLLWVQRIGALPDTLRLALTELAAPGSVVSLVPGPLPDLGTGPIVDTAVDRIVVPDGGTAHPGAFELIVPYAYARQTSATDARLDVGTVRYCVGYGGF